MGPVTCRDRVRAGDLIGSSLSLGPGRRAATEPSGDSFVRSSDRPADGWVPGESGFGREGSINRPVGSAVAGGEVGSAVPSDRLSTSGRRIFAGAKRRGRVRATSEDCGRHCLTARSRFRRHRPVRSNRRRCERSDRPVAAGQRPHRAGGCPRPGRRPTTTPGAGRTLAAGRLDIPIVRIVRLDRLADRHRLVRPEVELVSTSGSERRGPVARPANGSPPRCPCRS